MTAHDCLYVTSGWGVHDDRWVAALREVGYTPRPVSLRRDAHDDASLRELVLGRSDADAPVLAGPLHTVTRLLVGLPIRLVGLSWGYDLDELQLAGADLSWLAALDGLMVDSAANRTIAEHAGLSAERITFLPWGVDLAAFAPQGPSMAAADLGLPPESSIVLSLRAHEPRYRVGDVLEAFARTGRPDGALVIGHGGSLTEDLRAEAVRLGIADRTRFIGTAPEEQLPELLRGAACYVTASEVDGTSVTLLQAMACSTPVVASATAGNLQWVADDVTGLTFPTGDTTALARALDRVLSTDTSSMVARGRELVERDADWTANLSRLRQALASVS